MALHEDELYAAWNNAVRNLPMKDKVIFQNPEIDHGVVTWMKGR